MTKPDSAPAMQPREVCEFCGGPNIGWMYAHRPGCQWHPAPSPAPAMEEESIETLLEPLVLAAIRLNRLANSSIDMDEIDKATEVYAAARTALLAHYQELEQQGSEWRETATHLKGVLKQANAKISSLRASQITAEDARWLIDFIEGTPTKFPPEVTRIWRKLRLSASQATP